VTAVVDVTAPEGRLVVREAYPASADLVQELKQIGVRPWFPEEHAAWTDRGWIDVEALEGEPMPRSHP
jgi:hypothetical protein